MKRTVKLTGKELKHMIYESVKRIIKESYNDDDAYVSNYNDAMSDIEYDSENDGRVTPIQRQYQHDTMNDIGRRRDAKKYWTGRDLDRSDRLKKRWIQGKRSTNSLEDAEF